MGLFYIKINVKLNNMKNKALLILSIILIVFTQLLFAQAPDAPLDNESGTSMKPIINELDEIVDAMEAEGVEIVRMEFDILMTTKQSRRVLHSGYMYGIMIYGDYRFKEIGLIIYKDVDGEWIKVKEGELEEGIVTAYIEPSSKGEYLLEINAKEFVEGYNAGHYGLIILHD